MAGRVCEMINEERYSFSVLTLAGGPKSGEMDINLSEDQAGVLKAWLGPWQVKGEDATEIVRQNGAKMFTEGNDGNAVHGLGIFPVASFLNHSYMPNTIRSRYGDLMFIWSSRAIRANEEISLSYLSRFSNRSLQEREKRLRELMVPFVCVHVV